MVGPPKLSHDLGMSTIDPDARAAQIGSVLRPIAIVGMVIGVLCGPVIAIVDWAVLNSTQIQPLVFLIDVIVVVGTGLLAYYTPGKRSPLAIVAYVFSYAGGLLLVVASGTPYTIPNEHDILISFALVGAFYLVAVILVIKYILRDISAKNTNANGVQTTATITAAGVDGMVNYVQHQRLTLKFTDDKGVDRWVKEGRTGGHYQVGDTLPLRYDPAHPDRKRAIVVGF
jgi:hypothetical protein